MFFIIEKSEGTTFEFFPKFCKHLIKMETQKLVNLIACSKNEYTKFATKNRTLLTAEQRVTIQMKTQPNFEQAQ